MRGKRWIGVLLLALLLLLPLGAQAAENLVQNGDFSQWNESGLPEGWTYAAWTMDETTSTYWTEVEADGNRCVRLENFAENDARLEQTVAVRGNTTYRIAARLRAEGADPETTAANLSVSGSLALSEAYADTDGQWVDVELYGKTGFFQGEITVALRLGFYGAENVGTAWFDDVVVEEVDEVPAGVTVQSLQDAPVSAASGDSEGADWIATQTFVAAAFALLLCILAYRLRGAEIAGETARRALLGTLAAAAALRLFLSATNPGYEVDIGCFTSWGQTLAQVGPARFYEQVGFCDYPPGYLYVLGLQALAANLLGLVPNTAPYLLLLKLPAVACDIAAAYLLYRIALCYAKPKWALLAGAAYAFLPAAILDSAMWGQMDSVLALLILLTVDAFLQEKPLRAALLYGLAVLIKPQALMLGTIPLFGYALEIRKDARTGLKRLMLGVAACLAEIALLALPFLVEQGPLYLVEKYLSTLSSYPYATVNALNLFFALGANWVDQGQTLLGLPYAFYGTLGLCASAAVGLVFFFKSRDRRAIPLCTALVLVGAFCLGVRMHERYMFPALALLLLSALLYKDRRLFGLFAGFSATNAVNIYIVLQNEHVLPANQALGTAVALANLALLGGLIAVSARLCLREETVSLDEPLPPRRTHIDECLPDNHADGGFVEKRKAMRMQRLDYLLMAALTLVYAGFAFYQLGDTTAPQTLWEGRAGDSAVLDLGEVREIGEFRYYGEIPYGDFAIEFSDDGVSWRGAVGQSVGVHDMFKWHSVPLTESARYVRLTVTKDEIKLFEAACFDGAGQRLPVAACTAEALTDEQDIVPDEISYMNSMYFDEVYHGRTAYEQLHNMEWYENTHPPLGKVFISWSIAAFGMTPFAWRFAGTLAGVLMVPAMYLLCKTLFRRTLLAFFGAFLMTFDFMHLAQTRLGTIDSYPVLFIILAFACMLRYAYMSFYYDKLWKTFVPLALSGLFMGLGIASKWIGIYAAAGLAVLFFWIFASRVREYRRARRYLAEHGGQDAEKTENAERIARLFRGKAIKTILACVLFFGVIPLAIYIGSYYQFLRIDEPYHGLKEVWNYQLHMFNYHKGVFDSHPFESPWWQWPLDIRNIWYYVSDSMPQGYVSTISALGNPAVWWGGLAALLYVLVRTAQGHGRCDHRYGWIGIGFASNYLPWVLVPRVTFVYHYFASVPFLVLSLTLLAQIALSGNGEPWRRWKKWAKPAMFGFMGLVFALFLLFYPALTGVPMSETHAFLLRWLPTWTLY